jgi:hypothetical protein
VSASGLWLSYASAFTFAGCSIVLAARALGRSSVRQRTAFGAANLVTFISLMALRHPALAQRSSGLMEYWTLQRAFPQGTGILALLLWLARASSEVGGFFWRAPGWMVIMIAASGAISLWQAKLRAATLMLAAPIFLAMAASFAHLWPLGANQHMTFAAPAMILLLGQGCESIRRWLSQRRQWLGEAALAAFLVPVLTNSAYRAVFPRRNSDLRSVIEFFQRHRKPSDAVIAGDPATVEFYTGHDFRYASPPLTASARVWVISIPALRPQRLDEVLNNRQLLAGAESYGGAQARLFGPRSAMRRVETRR